MRVEPHVSVAVRNDSVCERDTMAPPKAQAISTIYSYRFVKTKINRNSNATRRGGNVFIRTRCTQSPSAKVKFIYYANPTAGRARSWRSYIARGECIQRGHHFSSAVPHTREGGRRRDKRKLYPGSRRDEFIFFRWRIPCSV